jgi:putative transposase
MGVMFLVYTDLELKSVSSRKLRQEFADHLEKFYWKDVFWSGSYFVASCGGVTVSMLRKYIEAQESPAE